MIASNPKENEETDPKRLMQQTNDVTSDVTVVSDDNEDQNGTDDAVIPISHPVLAYLVYALQSSTQENVKNTVLAHFSSEHIIDAKNSLWDISDVSVTGNKITI